MAKTANVSMPVKFTANNLVSYLAEKNEMSKTVIKQILTDFFYAAEAGSLAGQRVPFGEFGKLFIRIRPAQKARQGRNPATGEEITIKAKPATRVPKFSFSKSFKEKALKAKIQEKK